MRPVDGEEQCERIAEKLIFFVIADLANEFDERVVEKRLNHILEIFLISGVEHDERATGSCGYDGGTGQ
jgi:hypothetical protein